MGSRNRWALLGGATLLGFFAFTLFTSVLRRANSSFDYPSFSSLNNGDNGVRAFKDTLDRLGYQTSRNFSPIHRLTGTDADIFYIGPNLDSFQYTGRKELELFEHLAEKRANLVFVFTSESAVDDKHKGTVAKSAKTPSDRKPEKALETRWGVQLAYHLQPKRKDNDFYSAFMGQSPINWYFSSWTSDWIASQYRDGAPLILERHYGDGAILLVNGAKIFTNRELLTKPDLVLFASLLGRQKRIIFDESHLGVADTGSIAGLATRHHLQWLLLGFIATVSLYIWRSAVSFVPPRRKSMLNGVSGKDAYHTLSSLLAQSVPQKALLRRAAEEWNRSKPLRKWSSPNFSTEELQSFGATPAAQVPESYNAISLRSK